MKFISGILKRTGVFLFFLLWNIWATWKWSVPAAVCLILHYAFGLPMVFFWIALAVWIGAVIVMMKLVGWSVSYGSGVPDQFSAKGKIKKEYPLTNQHKKDNTEK